MGFLFSKNKKNVKEREKEIDALFDAGNLYFEKGDFDNSKRYFEKVIELNPDHEDAIHNLTIVMQKILLLEKKKHTPAVPPKRKVVSSLSKSQFGKKKGALNEAKTERDKFLNLLKLDKIASEIEIKEKISEEFKKWRTRVNSPDLKKRYEAEEKLSLISQAKRTLLKSL